MTPPVEQLVRAAVRDLAAQARPANLAPAALARGLRLRRRQRVLWTTGAVVVGLAVLAAIAVPTLVLGRGPGGHTDPGPAGTTMGVGPTLGNGATLFGGWTITSAGLRGGPFQVWNRDRRAYQQVDANMVYAAPTGPYVAITGEGVWSIDVLDLRGRNPRRFTVPDGYILEPQWSPDGTRLLLTTLDKDRGDFAITIINVGSGETTVYPVDRGYVCADLCQFTWSRDGTEIVWPLVDQTVVHDEAQPDPRSGLQLFSADDGHPTRTLPVKGNPWGPFAWSPNGRHVVVEGVATVDGRRVRQNQLVDIATGAVVRELDYRRAYWVTADRLLVAGDGPVRLLDPTGAEISSYDLPSTLRGGDLLPELGLA